MNRKDREIRFMLFVTGEADRTRFSFYFDMVMSLSFIL